jgi:hypothetical protein
MPKKTTVKPGQDVPKSGQYVPSGSGNKKGKEVTLIKDKTAPPTPKPGKEWVMVDPTDNKSGKG